MDDAEKFHGHMCPMYALGLRMGKKALSILGRGREDGVKLVAIIEYRNCLADGLQYICGTTYGKNNLLYREYGKFAASFYDLTSKKSVRLRVRKDVLSEVLKFGLRGQEIRRLPPDSRRGEAKMHFEKGKKIIESLNKMSDDELFEITEAPAFDPAEEPILKYEVCEECGEVVLQDYIKIKNKRKVCIPCARGLGLLG
jgi:formylmethanofuran dehydrogenase subunit E